MRFVAALSNYSDGSVLRDVLEHYPNYASLMRAVLVSPLTMPEGALKKAQAIASDFGIDLMFDSGGYQVQSGRLTYPELIEKLGVFIRQNPYADLHVLPDHVPHGTDDPDAVERKVQETIREGIQFYRQLPADLQSRALAVVQGRTDEQMNRCLTAYQQAGIRHIGVGGFAVGGKGGKIDLFTEDVMSQIAQLNQRIEAAGQTLHVFGIGSARWLPFMGWSGVTSVDSTNWAKSAGFGWVYLPLTGGKYAMSRATEQKERHRQQFLRDRETIGHTCPWCEDLQLLESSKRARSSHNLVCSLETMAMVQDERWSEIKRILAFIDPRHGRTWRDLTEGKPVQLEFFVA